MLMMHGAGNSHDPAQSRNFRKDASFRHLVEPRHVHLFFRRQLVCLSPCSNGLIVATAMDRIEVDKRRGIGIVLRLPPDLAEDANIGIAHEHLPQSVEAMRSVNSHNVLAVHKRALLLRAVVIVVPMESFAQEILQHVRS